MHTRVATSDDAASIAAIYNQGIEDRVATFETEPRTTTMVQAWFDGRHPIVVVEHEEEVIAYASSSAYRSRACYAGIAEFSVYVRRDWRGKGAGRLALSRLIKECERARFWKLVSRVFVENTASRALLQASGFREVGVYKKHGQLDGTWHDVVIVEYPLPAEDISASFDCELSSMTNRIDEAKPSDLASILVLLAHAGLPSEGLAELLPTTIVARQSGMVIGCAALEIYGTVALLRSVAVDPTHRLHGLGRLLVEKQLQQAHRRGIQNIYLLTETAHDYFQRFGFRPIERSAVSPAIHQSVEWTSVCPVSAQAMVRPLENG